MSYSDLFDKVWSMMKTTQYNDGLSIWVSYVIKTSQDNDVTDHIGVIYTENEIKLSWPIGSDVDYSKNKIKQLSD